MAHKKHTWSPIISFGDGDVVYKCKNCGILKYTIVDGRTANPITRYIIGFAQFMHSPSCQDGATFKAVHVGFIRGFVLVISTSIRVNGFSETIKKLWQEHPITLSQMKAADVTEADIATVVHYQKELGLKP